jgi:hypothetical protein
MGVRESLHNAGKCYRIRFYQFMLFVNLGLAVKKSKKVELTSKTSQSSLLSTR